MNNKKCVEIESYNQYHTHITSKHKVFDLDLKELWQYKDLIVMFTKRSFQLTYRQTILGPLWIFLNPFLTSIMYTLVFGGIAGMSTDGVPQILFYLCSNAIWTLFSTCVIKNSSTFTANANVFGKVYFPRLTVPISNAISSIVQFFIQMLLIGVFLLYFILTGEVSPNWLMWLLIPVILVHLGIMGIGIGIIISSLTTKYRDLSILVSFGVTLLMYASPIVYPLSQFDEGLIWLILMLNPITGPVELFRYALFGYGSVNISNLMGSIIFTIVVAVVGILIFNRVEKTFMDTV